MIDSHNILFSYLSFSQSVKKSTGKRFDETAKDLMVEVYTVPLYNKTQSTAGGVSYRNYKRQRIKFNSSIHFRDSIFDH
jgi:hypothetical protein